MRQTATKKMKDFLPWFVGIFTHAAFLLSQMIDISVSVCGSTTAEYISTAKNGFYMGDTPQRH